MRRLAAVRKLAEERGSASVIEYSVVLPLCFIIVVSVIAAAFVMARRASLDAAAVGAVQIAEMAYADPSFDGAYPNPYRFLGGGYDSDRVHHLMRQSIVRDLEADAPLFPGLDWGEPEITIEDGGFGPGRKAKVAISQEYQIPWRFFGEQQNTFVLRTSYANTLHCPVAEIRNADFLVYLSEKFTGYDLRQAVSSISERLPTVNIGGKR